MVDNTTGSRSTTANSSSEDVKDQLNVLRKDLTDLAETVKQQAKSKLSEAEDQARQRVGELEEQIREKPIQSALIAAGVGFLLGAILSR
jgi:ElaB/YqjD/DUF883 family membrane-anchored ribosome-binding protein